MNRHTGSHNPLGIRYTGVATVNNSGLVTGVTAGTCIISYTNTCNSGNTTTATVTVYDLPAITGTLTVCSGSTTQLTGSGTAASTIHGFQIPRILQQ